MKFTNKKSKTLVWGLGDVAQFRDGLQSQHKTLGLVPSTA